MLERDYIMRMVAQLSGVLAKIVFAKKAKNYDQALQIMHNAYGEMFGLEGQLVHKLHPSSLVLLLGQKEKIKALATLLQEEGDVLILQGKSQEGEHRYVKSLALFQELLKMQTSKDGECLSAIETLHTKLSTK